MNGNGNYGSCGAVTGVRSPIQLAAAIAHERSKPLSLSRVPPMYVVCIIMCHAHVITTNECMVGCW
jgi:hypothetical protein